MPHLMRFDEGLALALFLAAVVAIYVAATLALFRLAKHSLKRPARSGAVALSRVDWVALLLAAAGILCFLYGYFVEPYWLEVTRVRIESPKVASGSRAVRIVQLSDLHCERQARLEDKLPEVVAREHPDLIVFTGDAINCPQGLAVFKRCATRLSAIAPTFAVEGNHDRRQFRALNIFDQTGVRELNGQAISIEVAGAKICLLGASVDEEWRLQHILNSLPTDAFNIFIYHFPAAVFDIGSHPVDLLCAGHTHGGQVRLPLYGALITRSKTGKRFEAGLYRFGKTWLYVNRGIGMEGGLAPRVRFLSRPEVTVIELAPPAKA